MIHYILISVTIPDEGADGKRHGWANVKQKCEEKAKGNNNIVPLAENVWLVLRDQGMPFVAECVTQASEYKLKYEIRFLDADGLTKLVETPSPCASALLDPV